MAGSKERPRGPLAAVQEHARHETGASIRREREHTILAWQFEDSTKRMLDVYGVPDMEDQNRVRTPEAVVITARGKVKVQILGIKDSGTGLYSEISLFADYIHKAADIDKQFASADIKYDDKGDLKTTKYDLPKPKKLRRANEVLGFLREHYEKEIGKASKS